MKTQIYGNGKTMWMTYKDYGRYDGDEVCYEISDFIVTEINQQYNNCNDEIIPYWGGKSVIFEKPQESMDIDISLKVLPINKDGKPNLVVRNYKSGEFKPDMFKDIPVSKLFKEINKKLNERDNKGEKK